jgi:hypothetical protein
MKLLGLSARELIPVQGYLVNHPGEGFIRSTLIPVQELELRFLSLRVEQGFSPASMLPL